MDWAKAKSILILVFIAFNVFLFVSIGSYNFRPGISRETLANTQTILQSRGILLECKIPNYSKDARKLVYESGKSDMFKIVRNLLGAAQLPSDLKKDSFEIEKDGKKISLSNGNTLEYINDRPDAKLQVSDGIAVETHVRKFLTDMGIAIRNYELDRTVKNPDGSLKLVYIEKYKEFFVYGNNLEVVVTGRGITGLTYEFKKVKGFSSDSPVKVMPAHQVLLKNFSGDAPAEIIKVDLGFIDLSDSREEMKVSSEVPVWRVVLKDGECRYFEVKNGEKIR